MSDKQLREQLKRYLHSRPNSQLRRNYLRSFVPKMLYRTTKTENPTTTKKQVQDVLKKVK